MASLIEQPGGETNDEMPNPVHSEQVLKHGRSLKMVAKAVSMQAKLKRRSDLSCHFDTAHRLHLLTAAVDKECMLLLLRNCSYGYPNTDGTLWSNYKAYVLNRHPLLSIVTAHPLHPFSHAERLVVLVCSFCWAFFVNAMMSLTYSRFCGGDSLGDCGLERKLLALVILALLIIPYEASTRF